MEVSPPRLLDQTAIAASARFGYAPLVTGHREAAARPTLRAWLGGAARLKDAPKRSRRYAFGAEGAPILDPAHPAKPGGIAAGTEKRHPAEPRNDPNRAARAGSSVRRHAEDGRTRLSPLSRSGSSGISPHEQAQRKASHPYSTRRMNSGSRPVRRTRRRSISSQTARAGHARYSTTFRSSCAIARGLPINRWAAHLASSITRWAKRFVSSTTASLSALNHPPVKGPPSLPGRYSPRAAPGWR